MNRWVLLACVLFWAGVIGLVQADTVYVDLNVPHTYHTYNVATRDSLSGDQDVYNTIQKAIDSTAAGMTVILRGGTYQQNHIRLSTTKNGTAWTEGNYNTLQSMDGEWAIIDGQNLLYDRYNLADTTRAPPLIGSSGGGATDSRTFWKFSRIELTGGRSKFRDGAYGFFADGGPFWFTHCYVHGNKAPTGSSNPSGIGGYVWNNSIVEYCLFEDNGSDDNDHNSSDIMVFSDYNFSASGFAGSGFVFTSGEHLYKNEFRYNLFLGNSGVNIKYKGSQLLTGRNPAGGHPFDDTYKEYGDKIHHNICIGSLNASIRPRQDFIQVYNNVILDCYRGIMIEQGETMVYRMMVYNNTLIRSAAIAIAHSHTFPDSFGEYNIYTHMFNNFVDSGQEASSDGGSISSYRYTGDTVAIFDSLHISNNVINNQVASYLDPLGIKPIFIGSSAIGPSPYYTVGRHDSVFASTDTNWNIVSSIVYQGDSGVAALKLDGSFVLSGSRTIGNGGANIAHPYLAGWIPGYIGANDPEDDDIFDTIWDLRYLPTSSPAIDSMAFCYINSRTVRNDSLFITATAKPSLLKTIRMYLNDGSAHRDSFDLTSNVGHSFKLSGVLTKIYKIVQRTIQ